MCNIYSHIVYGTLAALWHAPDWKGVPNAGLLLSAWSKVLQQASTQHQLVLSLYPRSLSPVPGHLRYECHVGAVRVPPVLMTMNVPSYHPEDPQTMAPHPTEYTLELPTQDGPSTCKYSVMRQGQAALTTESAW